jgi:DNA-binding MurR/RpiR family transcriptional regulator
MMDIENVIADLTRSHADMSPQLKRAAEFVLKNPSLVAMHSMRRVASEAGVTPPTMLRMVKAIGFDGYEDFREFYRKGYHLIAGDFGDRARKLQLRKDGDKTKSLWSDLIHANNAHLQQLVDTIRPAQFKRAAKRLLRADRVYVVGMLSSYSFATYLHYVARMALPNWHLLSARGSMLADEIATLNPKDAVIAIGFAPYAVDTVRLAKLARQRKTSVVAITDGLTSPLAGQADDVFVAPNDSPQFFGSFVATLALIEALIAYVVNQGGKDLVENIATVEKTREAFKEYWSPKTGDEEK